MTLPALTLPPTAPSRSDPPATFITRADAFVQWQSATFVTEMNNLLPAIVLAGSATNYSGTSTTSLLIGTGSKTFTTQTNLAFVIGQFVQIANTGTPANYMFGQVTAYNSGTGSMTVLVSAVGGSGTLTAWTIGLAASSGAYAQLSGATYTGAVITVASTTGGAGLNIPHGAAPTTPTNGDLWTTTGGIFARVNGVTQTFLATSGGALGTTLTITPGSGTPGLIFSQVANQAVYTRYQRSASTRWDLGMSGNAETGGNAGSDFYLSRYTDAGAFIDFPFSIPRATGVAVFSATPSVAGDPIVTRTSTDTLTNKTLTAPTINSATLASPTVNSASFDPQGGAPAYAARAWVNFNGTGTVAIVGSGNISSITDGGVGTYTVNFTTAMPDALYGVAGFAQDDNGADGVMVSRWSGQTFSSSALGIKTISGASVVDTAAIHVAIFR